MTSPCFQRPRRRSSRRRRANSWTSWPSQYTRTRKFSCASSCPTARTPWRSSATPRSQALPLPSKTPKDSTSTYTLMRRKGPSLYMTPASACLARRSLRTLAPLPRAAPRNSSRSSRISARARPLTPSLDSSVLDSTRPLLWLTTLRCTRGRLWTGRGSAGCLMAVANMRSLLWTTWTSREVLRSYSSSKPNQESSQERLK